VWPKLLAGSLSIVVVLLLVREGVRAGWTEVVLAALAAGLAFLAHPGAAFTFLAIAPFLLKPERFPGLAKALAGVAVFAALVGPWLAYQRWYDPPGNRLLKWHLAGVIEIDERPFGQALREAYASLSARQVVGHKWDNVQALVGLPLIEPRYSGPSWREVWKNGEYYNLLKALGVLNVGWLVLAASWFRRRLAVALGEARRVMGIALLAVLIWVVLMFGPGTTWIYQGSFATVLLLFAGLAAAVSQLPGKVTAALLAIHVLDLIIVWLIP
jgi:hypothetical protein